MLTVKCPHCSTALKLQKAPASGKVKCPKCSNVVPVAAASPASAQPAAAKPKARPTAAAPAMDPDDDSFDFGRISFPSASAATAVSQFPVASNASVYEGPIPGDPLAQTEEEEGGDDQGGQVVAAPAKKKKNPLIIVGALAGVGLLLICGIAAAVMFGGGGGGEAKVDVVAAAKKTAPSGYKAVGLEGCVVLMPKGSELEELPSVSDTVAIRSTESGSVFLLAAMNGGIRPLDKDQMRKKAERQLGGEILGGNEMERNKYKGIKGMLDGSIFLPRMQVEVFHIEERFVIIGCAPASMGADPSMKFDRALEAAEQEIFYGSFKVGPKPSGWLF